MVVFVYGNLSDGNFANPVFILVIGLHIGNLVGESRAVVALPILAGLSHDDDLDRKVFSSDGVRVSLDHFCDHLQLAFLGRLSSVEEVVDISFQNDLVCGVFNHLQYYFLSAITFT